MILVLDCFGVVVLYCVTGSAKKLIFGAGTSLIIESSKFINAMHRHIFYDYMYIIILVYYYELLFASFDLKKNYCKKKLKAATVADRTYTTLPIR